MKYINPSSYDDLAARFITLRVNSTFEHRDVLETSHNESSYAPFIRLNRQACLLLNFLGKIHKVQFKFEQITGAPYALFERLLWSELTRIKNATHSRKDAYELIQRDYKTVYNTESESMDDENNIKALRFLTAGHDLNEPQLLSYIKQLQMKGYLELFLLF